jgi:DNA-binding NarL/FixJ family response regulator
MIRVVIVDDHPMLREGTRGVLAQHADITVVGMAETGAAALHLVAELRPDVLLLDVHLPDRSGVDVARHVRSSSPNVAILVVTGYDDAGYVRTLLGLGVLGYLYKSVPGDQIVQAVRAVARGEQAVAKGALQRSLGNNMPALTSREHEVLRLLATGRRNAEIATALGVSVNTVEFHVGNLLQKLDVHSRTEALVRARQHGLIDSRLHGEA